MDEILTRTFLTALLSGAVVATVPLLLAAVGETISERAGVLNVGLEGFMLGGAYVGFVVTLKSDSQWLGMGAAALAGVAVAAVMAVLCVRFGLDQIVVGIAILLTVEGVTSLLQGAQYGTTYPRLPSSGETAIPLLDRIPVVGPGLFDQHLAVYLTGVLVALTGWMLRSTRFGLNIRAAGERPAAVDAAGVGVIATRTWAELACGALAGLGGGFLAIVGAGIFVPFMTAGTGFMAIVVAMLGRGKPLWVAVGASIFGTALALQTALQIAGIEISNDLVQALPFVSVIVALLLFGRRSALPATLGLPYVRGAR